jgi:hypothetical protein
MKRYEFTAHGKYPFPLDMLRYDGCYPLQPGDVSKMQEAIVGPPALGQFRDRPILHIRLVSYLHAPTEDRWRSFGWFVEGLDERKVS